ncbi:MAG: FAD binding domain-containing protein [Melioribacteraceae bacterium]|nr:FAD binding domain-containing protein [Melioribacteraceae bacterium]
MQRKISLIVNNELVEVEVNPGSVLLDLLRDTLKLTGTKEGCREGDCGACTVIVGKLKNGKIKYRAINSCLYPIGNAAGKHILTIEGINTDSLNKIQKLFYDEGASQCGFCTPGFIMSLTAHLLTHNKLMYDEVVNSVAGNICRCTGYSSIKRAIKELTTEFVSNSYELDDLINKGLVPDYLPGIKERLISINELISERSECLQKHHKIIGGGTDLFVQTPEELFEHDLTFISQNDMCEINFKGNRCFLGSTVTFEMIKTSTELQQYFPMMDDYFKLVASLQIRNSATIAGNIVNASPIGGMSVILLALNASIIISNKEEKKVFHLKDLFLDYKKLNMEKDDIIEWIVFNLPNGKFNFEKVSKRRHLDIASVNSAMYIDDEEGIVKTVYISGGGVAPIPLFLKRACEFLTGKEINKENIIRTIEIAETEISPISDVRGSADYKRLLFKQLLKAHFLKFYPQQIKMGDLL